MRKFIVSTLMLLIACFLFGSLAFYLLVKLVLFIITYVSGIDFPAYMPYIYVLVFFNVVYQLIAFRIATLFIK